MPSPSDILQFMRGQLFQTPTLPNVDFSGKTVIVTGANSGLGFECARQLVHLKISTLILACRTVSKGTTAKDQILSTLPSSLPRPDIRVWQIDMASYSSVKAFAKRIDNELPRLDALIANAGISTNVYSAAEGLEQTLTVNVTSTFLLSLLCLPILQRTAKETNAATHLTIVGSNVHAFADPQEITSLPQGKVLSTLSDSKKANMSSRYFLSKLLVMLCVRHLASSATTSTPDVIINCPSPGWCKTPLFRQDDGGFMGRSMLKLIGREAEVGARCLTSAIVAGRETHGEYLSEEMVKRVSVWVRSEEGRRMQVEIWEEVMGILEAEVPGLMVMGEKKR